MTERYVLDASALLCLLDDQPGAERVAEVLDHAAVTAVTLAVVAAEMMQRGVGRDETAALLGALHLKVIEVGVDQAIDAAMVGSRHPNDSESVEQWCWLAAADKAGAVAMTASGKPEAGPGNVEVVGAATTACRAEA